jgi:hypothetical protein
VGDALSARNKTQAGRNKTQAGRNKLKAGQRFPNPPQQNPNKESFVFNVLRGNGPFFAFFWFRPSAAARE